MRRALTHTLLATALLLPLALTAATPAQASPDPSISKAPAATTLAAADTTCAAGDLCFWVNTSKGGAKGRVSGDNTTWGWAQSQCADGTWNNCASSIQNNGTYCEVNVYENASYGGASLRINRGTYISNLYLHFIRPFDTWNDDIQSNKWVCG